jgi:hypothetical protein
VLHQLLTLPQWRLHSAGAQRPRPASTTEKQGTIKIRVYENSVLFGYGCRHELQYFSSGGHRRARHITQLKPAALAEAMCNAGECRGAPSQAEYLPWAATVLACANSHNSLVPTKPTRPAKCPKQKQHQKSFT